MPIGRLEFEGLSPDTEEWMYRVHAFLKENSDLAYNDGELKEAVPGITGPLLADALDLLSYLGAIDRRVVGGQEYAAFLNDISDN
jgi:hypothetical protein